MPLRVEALFAVVTFSVAYLPVLIIVPAVRPSTVRASVRLYISPKSVITTSPALFARLRLVTDLL